MPGNAGATRATRLRSTGLQLQCRQFAFVDRRNLCVIAAWRGKTARRLIASGRLPRELVSVSRISTDKTVVRDLILEAAKLTTDPSTGEPALQARLDALGLKLNGALRQVAEMVFEHPEHHHSIDDVRSLLALSGSLLQYRVAELLQALLEMGVLMQVVVDSNIVFYDVNTSPHLHIFDAHRCVLEDAPATGIVRQLR